MPGAPDASAIEAVASRAGGVPAAEPPAAALRRVASRIAVGLLLTVVLVSAGVVAASPGYAEVDPAQPTPEAVSAITRYQVTLAARVCKEYAQIMGGRTRADDVESADAPGQPGVYAPGQLVEPDLEARGGAACEPMSDWRFTLGTGRQRRGSLSSVTGVSGEAGPTKAEVPRLDSTGLPTASQPGSARTASAAQASGDARAGGITGAVTLTLSDDQVASAMRRELWVQGGRPNDPLLGRTDLEFGALRCGLDTRSGSNAAWIGFPAGARHVYCYAYYVRGAAEPGTIVVRARLTRPVGYPQGIAFTASFSYATSKAFTLTTSGQPVEASFARTAGQGAHQLGVQPPAGWKVADLSCAATRSRASGRASGLAQSQASVSVADGRATLTLAAAETITCTYALQPPAQQPGLTVRFFSDGGAGTFLVRVASQSGAWSLAAAVTGDGPTTATDTGASAANNANDPKRVPGATGTSGSATATGTAGTDLSAVGPGTYTATVTPPDPAGAAAWILAGANCSGSELKPAGLTVTIPVTAGVPVECVLRMARPAGIRLRAATTGAAATVALAVEPADSITAGRADSVTSGRADGTTSPRPDNAAAGWTASATTRPAEVTAETSASGLPVDAQGLPVTLPAGAYVVTPLAPRVTMDVGWRLTGLACEPAAAGKPSAVVLGPDGAASSGALIVTVAAGAALPVCMATYQAVPAVKLQVELRFSGTPVVRTGAAVVEVNCGDGARGRVVLEADDLSDQELPTSLSFLTPTRCVITQPSTGASDDGEVIATAVLEPAPGNAPLVLPATIEIGREITRYTVTVTDAFEAVVARPRSSVIQNPFRTLPIMLVGSGLIGLGVVFLLAVVARRNRASGPLDSLLE